MATSELVRPKTTAPDVASVGTHAHWSKAMRDTLAALASLRLTVVLFALSIFLVFVGTLAQKDYGVWYVVDHAYFRVWFARINFQVFERLVQMFFPVHWELTGNFYFPGGKLIGAALLLNLLAAHGVRFKVAASGARLWSGLALVAIGALVTALVIHSGMDDAVESDFSPAFGNLIWHAFRAGLAAVALAGGYALALSHDRIRRTEWRILLGIDLVVATVAAWLFFHPELRLDDSGLRILWQLAKGLGAGAVLLAGCVLAFRGRAGIVLLHGGVALLMCSELWTGLTATEAQMAITEGQTINFASDIRSTELAVIDRSHSDYDRVTAVPARVLRNNVGASEPIEHPGLPFAIRVHRWLPNAEIVAATPGSVNPATAGAGMRFVAEERPAATGVDSSAAVDRPAAYVEIISKSTGESLGTYLATDMLREQPVETGGKSYDLELRFRRIYYPYTLTLKDFRFDRYVGTETAKNYSSLVELKDPAHNVDREIDIWMNNPLRYAGSTFYQADFDQATEKTTYLQVVKNPGWMAPYVACVLVAIGMLAHFGLALTRFLRRRADRPAGELELAGGSAWTLQAVWFPALVVLVFAGYLGSKARMPHSAPSEMQVYRFASLPLAYQGRIKPYDTVARNALQYLSGRQELSIDDDGTQLKLPAIRWLLDVIAITEAADEHRVFRIENLELLDVLELEPREGSWRYSMAELDRKKDELENQIQLATAVPEVQLSLFQRKVVDLAKKRNFYAMLRLSFRSLPTDDDLARLGLNTDQLEQFVASMPTAMVPLPVPPDAVDGPWSTLLQAELDARRDASLGHQSNPATAALGAMLQAYASEDATTFNKELTNYRQILDGYERSLIGNSAQLAATGLKNSETLSQRRIDFEVFFNQFSPFYYGMVLYVTAFVLGVLSWLGWTEPLRRASVWLLVFTFVIHTFALGARIYISGRPPITNLYSTATFIGWACVGLALVFESLHRLGLGNIVAAVIGFITLFVAHNLSLDGDTFIVLQAVLDTQFWLATHVITINLGYATTYMAGTLGIAYVIFAHVFPALDDEQRRRLTRMTYGTLCFAIFFSFVGTVLGGLWADDSWGRFWGWDPKENGALMIVLYNALVLHARWGGMVTGRGLALLAIGGNIVTTWSYFGTNQLGVGLHTYGASETNTANWLLVFAASQAALIALGAVPRDWFQFRRTAPTARAN